MSLLSAAESFNRGLQAHQAGDIYTADDYYAMTVETDPLHKDAWNNMGVIALQMSQVFEAEKKIRRAISLDPSDDGAKRNLASCLTRKAAMLERSGEFSAALDCAREAMPMSADPIQLRAIISNILSASDLAAQKTDFFDESVEIPANNPLVVMSMPRAGGIYFAEAIARTLNRTVREVACGKDEVGQEIVVDYLAAALARPSVIQLQQCASNRTLQLLRVLGAKPLVLVRNIYDAVISQVDAIEKEPQRRWYFSNTQLATMNRAEKIDWVIAHFASWSMQFYASWAKVEAERLLELQWVRYETILDNRSDCLTACLDYWGLPSNTYANLATFALLEKDHASTRYNRGEYGYGKSELSQAQIEAIAALADRFGVAPNSPLFN